MKIITKHNNKLYEKTDPVYHTEGLKIAKNYI